MSFDAYPNHVAGSFMIAVTSTDNPVPSQSGSSQEPKTAEPNAADHAADAEPDSKTSSNDTAESST